MADLDELEKVGKKTVATVTAAIIADAKLVDPMKGSVWTETCLAIAAYVDEPGEFTRTTQGQRMMMRQQKNRSVSFLELTRDGRTVRIEVYDITSEPNSDEWPDWSGGMGI